MPTDDNPFFSPTHKAPPKPPKPREVLFTFLRADDVPMSGVLFNNGDFGWEAQFLERGELFFARGGYGSREEAIAWANTERRGLEG
jgi:hypothetical protein